MGAGAPHERRALHFILLLGVVSLFADMTYEGARSIAGPFFATLGANGTVVGVVAGLGELVSYAVRLLSGYLSDRTGSYWAITLLGYLVNLFSVPLLALAGRWETAAALVVAERFGKAVRNPARDAMLSHAVGRVGRGWGFGLHEALDQIGAVCGPLLVALILFLGGGYRRGFAFLLLPALLATAVLVAARLIYPTPRDLEEERPNAGEIRLPPRFWLYMGAVALTAAGYVDYPLLAFHFQKSGLVAPRWMPLLYALAMGADAAAALALGRLFDRIGLRALALGVLLAAGAVPLALFGGLPGALAGLALWGVGMGAQESVLRAVVAGMVPRERRGTAYGIFNTGYGVAWFAGSALTGFLYDVSRASLAVFSILAQVLSVAAMLLLARREGE